MSSHNYDKKNSIVLPNSKLDTDSPSEHAIDYQDLYRASPTANRAYEKYVARGHKHGHDVEDWLASEREIEAEQREQEAVSTSPSSQRALDHHDGMHQR
jgi:hypothetical protein